MHINDRDLIPVALEENTQKQTVLLDYKCLNY